MMIKDKYLIWGMGFGLVLYAVHNKLQPGLDLGIFLPQIGLAITVICSLGIILRKGFDIGPKWLWIPMAVMVVSMPLSWVFNGDMNMAMASLMMGLALFAFYMAARKVGIGIFKVFVPFVIIEAVSVIGYGIALPGIAAGGIMTSPPTVEMTANYDIAAGFIIFGTIVAAFERQWLLAGLALVALFFTGAGEAIFVMGVLGIIVIARRDWSKKLLYAVMPVVVVAVLWTGLGYTQQLYEPTIKLAEGIYEKLLYQEPHFKYYGHISVDGDDGLEVSTNEVVFVDGYKDSDVLFVSANPPDMNYEILPMGQGWENLGGRFRIMGQALQDIKPFGHGYKPGMAEETTVHNLPIIIVDQIGPLAALAYTFMVIMLLIKTRWKYVWVAIIACGIFDHYLFTQIAPYLWVMAGVSSATALKSDLIFKRVVND